MDGLDFPVLLRLRGELYLPLRECDCGHNHFVAVDSAEIFSGGPYPVRPETKILQIVREMLRNVGDKDCYEGSAGSANERVNLAYQQEWDHYERLMVPVSRVVDAGLFDFWVGGQFIQRPQRFAYRNKAVLSGGKRVGKTDRVDKYFADVGELEVAYVGTLGVEFEKTWDTADMLPVEYWAGGVETRHREHIKKELKMRFGTIYGTGLQWEDVEAEAGADLRTAVVLLALSGGRVGESEVEEKVSESIERGNYMCSCDPDVWCWDVLDGLIQRDVVSETDGRFSIGQEPDEEVEEEYVYSEHPGQLSLF